MPDLLKEYSESNLLHKELTDKIILVDDKVIIEAKTCYELDEAHVLQLMNYLKATSIEVGLVLNFGVTPQFKRRLFTNDKKDIQKIRENQSNPSNQCIP